MEIWFRVNLYRDQPENEFGTNGTKYGTKVGTNGTNDKKDHKLSDTLKTLNKRKSENNAEKEISEAVSVPLHIVKREIARMQEDGDFRKKRIKPYKDMDPEITDAVHNHLEDTLLYSRRFYGDCLWN